MPNTFFFFSSLQTHHPSPSTLAPSTRTASPRNDKDGTVPMISISTTFHLVTRAEKQAPISIIYPSSNQDRYPRHPIPSRIHSMQRTWTTHPPTHLPSKKRAFQPSSPACLTSSSNRASDRVESPERSVCWRVCRSGSGSGSGSH